MFFFKHLHQINVKRNILKYLFFSNWFCQNFNKFSYFPVRSIYEQVNFLMNSDEFWTTRGSECIWTTFSSDLVCTIPWFRRIFFWTMEGFRKMFSDPGWDSEKFLSEPWWGSEKYFLNHVGVQKNNPELCWGSEKYFLNHVRFRKIFSDPSPRKFFVWTMMGFRKIFSEPLGSSDFFFWPMWEFRLFFLTHGGVQKVRFSPSPHVGSCLSYA